MPHPTRIEVATEIAAPPDVCFDLARDIDFHAKSMAATRERVILRPNHSLLELHDTVAFAGTHFGIRFTHHAILDRFDRPHHFRDTMTRGSFKSFVHDHHFTATSTGTRMRDAIHFTAPFRPLSITIEKHLLLPHLSRLLHSRAQAIKIAAKNTQSQTPS